MNRKWATINSWMVVGVICAAAWIVGGGGWVAQGRSESAGTSSAKPRAAADREWQPPVMLENPFYARERAVEASVQTPAQKRSRFLPQVDDLTLPIAGEQIETDLPVIYRLPPVTPDDVLPELPELPQETPPAPQWDDRPIETIEPRLPPDDIARRPDRVPEKKAPARAAADTSAFPYKPRPAEMHLFAPTSNELTAQLLPAVRRGCDLAQRGALYAAKTEFIQVIRRIAQVNDAERGTDEHSRALAEGLRAIEEAADFVPDGAGLEGDLDVAIAASSHRTPLVRQSPASVAPHTAVALYHGFAQERLAKAVAGQQAGSMALFGLGKVHARLAARNDDDVLATRSAMTMYLAALAACPVNHLAANELGVLLCRNGHAAEASRLFEQTIDQAANATAYHNLAVAQQKMGLVGQAAANQRESDRLAAWERATGAVSRRAGVEWMPANQFAQAAPSPVAGTPVADYSRPPMAATGQNAPAPIPYRAAPVAEKSPLQKAAALAKSISLPGTGGNDKSLHAAPAPRAAAPAPVAARRNTPWF